MKNIDSVFQELVALDPEFAKYETQVRALIQNLIANKPEVRIDEDFVARLRSQLTGAPTPSPFSYMSFFSSHYVTLGILVLIVAAPFGFYASTHRDGAAVFSMDQQIQKIESGAYGTIQSQDGGKGGGMAYDAATVGAEPTIAPSPAPETANQSMAVAAPAAATADAKVATMSMTAASGGGTDARMMLPVGPITTYSYVYKGEALDLSASEGAVYRHVKSENSSGQIASQLRRFNFGLINLGAYADAKIRSFELVQEKPYGYSISVNFDEGTININPDYTHWPSLSGKEPMQQQLPKNEMLSEQQIYAMSDAFLKAHDISTTNYADPVIQDYEVGLEADAQLSYAPEQVSVIYPLKIEGTEVIEDGAYPYGLQVTVSIRDKRVMSVYGLNSQTYTSSDYQLVTDSAKVLSVLGKGGPHAWDPTNTGVQVKKVEVEVGAPTKVLMHTYSYKDGQSQELFVPALSFPVLKSPEADQYYPKSIVVPLVPELLESNQGGPILYDTMLR